ncbi:DALR anticodon-binding domain-containing protein [Actinomadura sp. DC4]|uniref:DALR anticodon-binding domain-containing protein n=1 Tax=Actinomadura sp. DC4 TaxID=3055069 RepID=UPI0025AF7D9D|nr:DALR anticodon-binding domain-containing protein [Actinomadura sp. DC4]MDN3351792.1 DALR anticodon-binding domain-containing protein [Actinomadura sp. DC4]
MTPGSLAHVSPGDLSSAVIGAVRDAVADGDITVSVPDTVHIQATATGDYATPLPLRLAEAAGRPAPEVAALLAQRLAKRPEIGEARATGPGFLTITLGTPLLKRIDENYGLAEVPMGPTWPVRPMTFENTGFRVRFAYARASGVQRHAADLGIPEGPATTVATTDPREHRLTGLLADFPGRAEQAARQDDPRPLARHLELIADAYHDVHEQCPALPKGDEPAGDRHIARLGLARAVRIVLGNGLRMLGETPDDRL